MRRAAISIPSNIAEGPESGFDKLGIRYFYNAKGSVAELKNQVILAYRINYIDNDKRDEIIDKLDCIAKMLNKLIAYRKSRLTK
jgi:four helix bundle protein